MNDNARIAAHNAQLADALVAALTAHGVSLFFVCPGSRSTPLVLAIERAQAPTLVLLDERVAGYAAVGAARLGVPAAVVTTSGTAVSNLVPALSEADVDELPIVALTADRPHEAVHTGANQTTDQVKLLAGVVRHTLDVTAPDARALDAQQLADALHDALGHLSSTHVGPVHLNVRFTKPLEGQGGEQRLPAAPAVPRRAWASPPAVDLEAWANAAAPLIIVGALPAAERAHVEAFVGKSGVPACVDITSGLSHRREADAVVVPAALLRDSVVTEHLHPDVVLWLGGTTVDDAPAQFARRCRENGASVLQWRSGDAVRDPFFAMTRQTRVDFATLRDVAVDRRAPPAVSQPHGQHLLRASIELALLDASDTANFTEAEVARVVARASKAEDVLVLGNSMPVRDVGRFVQSDRMPTVVVNRGLSGIDGTFATALGAWCAEGFKRTVTVLLGDLSALHDLTGLLALQLAAQRHPLATLRIVVINNDGGGIFHFLPAHDDIQPSTFDKFFGTAHGQRLAPLAAAMGITVCTPVSSPQLECELASAKPGVTLFEVVTERDDNLRTHRRQNAIFARRLSEAPPELLFVHGAFGSARDGADVLAAVNANARALDLFGHGQRAADVPPRLSFESAADDIDAQVRSLGVTRAVLYGYSMGARVALALLARPPTWLAGLVLEGAHVGLLNVDARAQRLREDEAFAAALTTDVDAALASFYQRDVFAGLRAHPLFAARAAARIADAKRQPAAIARVIAGLSLGAQTPAHDVLRHARIPIVAITGEQDHAYTAMWRERSATHMHIRHHVVATASHAPHFEAPAAVAAIIADVLHTFRTQGTTP